MSKRERLMPNNVPRYVRCYDDGGEGDRYTVVFTRIGHIDPTLKGGSHFLSLNRGGYFYRGFTDTPIDKPAHGHLGKKIQFSDLPEECQSAVRIEYEKLWGIELR